MLNALDIKSHIFRLFVFIILTIFYGGTFRQGIILFVFVTISFFIQAFYLHKLLIDPSLYFLIILVMYFDLKLGFIMGLMFMFGGAISRLLVFDKYSTEKIKESKFSFIISFITILFLTDLMSEKNYFFSQIILTILYYGMLFIFVPIELKFQNIKSSRKKEILLNLKKVITINFISVLVLIIFMSPLINNYLV